MFKPLKLSLIGGGILLLTALFLHDSPPDSLPGTAKRVYFSESAGWQYWNFCLRFDADPKICREYAIQLMIEHGVSREDIGETTIQSHDFGKLARRWMKVEPFEKGILIMSKGGWITAVVDQDRGRLYYRGFN